MPFFLRLKLQSYFHLADDTWSMLEKQTLHLDKYECCNLLEDKCATFASEMLTV